MRGSGVATRTGRLETSGRRVDLRREAARLAADLGIPTETLLEEAEALLVRAGAAGARTEDQITAFTAGELGISPDELRADLSDLAGLSGGSR